MQQSQTIDSELMQSLPRTYTIGQGAPRGGLVTLPVVRRRWFWSVKRAFDIAASVCLIPVVLLAAVVVAVFNRKANPGALMFRQVRMGRNCEPFTIYKFRTMLETTRRRGPEDPVETDRITPFGHFMRRTRIDELPQILNILRGEMSFVGPRPDMFDHARRFLDTVPHYHLRHAVRPGITGFAQVTCGYAEGTDGTVEKARQDVIYIRRACAMLELKIMLRTVYVIFSGHGAR